MKHIKLSQAEKSELMLSLDANKRDNFEQALIEFDKVLSENYEKSLANGNDKFPLFGKLELSISHLFQRFLTGQTALPYPPPNSFGLPWYDIVESDDTFIVTISDAVMVNSVLNPNHQKNAKLIAINHANWQIDEENEAAEKLFEYVRYAQKHEMPAHKIDDLCQYIAAGPKFVLHFPHYGQFCLQVEEVEHQLTQEKLNKLHHWYHRFCMGNNKLEIISEENIDGKLTVKGDFWTLRKQK